jgi:hypothetical protein
VVGAVAAQAGRGPQLQRPRPLAAGDPEGAVELGLDGVPGGAERGQALGPVAAGLRLPQPCPGVRCQGEVGGRQPAAGVPGRGRRLQQHPQDAGPQPRRVLRPAAVVQRPPDAGQPGLRVAVEDVEVPGERLDRDLDRPCLVPPAPGTELGGVPPEVVGVAQLQGEQGGEDQGGGAAVGVPDLVGQGQGGVAGPGRGRRPAQEPEGDPEHVVAFDHAHGIPVALATVPQPRADPARPDEVARTRLAMASEGSSGGDGSTPSSRSRVAAQAW